MAPVASGPLVRHAAPCDDCRVTRLGRLSRLAGLVTLAVSACSDGGYDVIVRFETRALAAAVDRVEVSLVPACAGLTPGDAPTGAAWQTLLRRGETGAPVGDVQPRSYGLYARGWGAGCAVAAAGCLVYGLEAGGSGELSVTLAALAGGPCSCATGETVCTTTCADLMRDSANCGACGRVCGPGTACSAGVCTTAMDAGGPRDAGVDAAIDSGIVVPPGLDAGLTPPPDAGPGSDAGSDAGTDAGSDAGLRTCRTSRECDRVADPCVSGNCTGGVCVYTYTDGRFCSDGQTCTTGDHCAMGVCVGTPMAVGATCSDGNVCTSPDRCAADGTCSSTVSVGSVCDDGNACTATDRCAADGSCAGTIRSGSACTDGNPCTLTDRCTAAGSCVGVTAPAGSVCIDDGNVCTSDVCSGASCTHPTLPDGTACDDGTACSLSHYCAGGSCVCA